MSAYRNILVAVDFGPGHDQVVGRASTLAATEGARLGLVHVVDFLHIDLASELVLPQDMELEAQIVATARTRLEQIAAGMQSAQPVSQWVEMGSTKQEILRVAEDQTVDLIVIGSHGRRGLGRLLGATANAVLHGAPCDVLAVHIRED